MGGSTKTIDGVTVAVNANGVVEGFPALTNTRALDAARGKAVDRVPVWIMRQAGRYLPEYREYMKDKTFFQVCQNPAMATAITLQPIERFDLDASIIFSDILVVPQALGLVVEMRPGTGPHFPEPLRTPADLARVKEVDEIDVDATLGYVFDALTLCRTRLAGRATMIGFCGGPWTLMCYMAEGGGSRLFMHSKTWLYTYRSDCLALMRRITEVLVKYLVGQAKAGAQMLQVFESWAGELSQSDFYEVLLPLLKEIAARVRKETKALGLDVPLIVFAKGAHYALPALSDAGYDVVSVDWTIDPATAREQTGGKVTLQGNMDPGVLYGDAETIQATAKKMVAGFGKHRLIGNLGHGMHPQHDPEKLRAYIDAVHAQ